MLEDEVIADQLSDQLLRPFNSIADMTVCWKSSLSHFFSERKTDERCFLKVLKSRGE
jgi:hypothetical protein